MSLKDFLKDYDFIVPIIIAIYLYIANKGFNDPYINGLGTGFVIAGIIFYLVRRL